MKWVHDFRRLSIFCLYNIFNKYISAMLDKKHASISRKTPKDKMFVSFQYPSRLMVKLRARQYGLREQTNLDSPFFQRECLSMSRSEN